MTADEDNEAFAEFVRGRSTALLRTAVLLTGGDRGSAEDLLRGVLERTYLRWRRIQGPPEAYARRALVYAAANRWRLHRRRPEAPLAWAGEPAAPAGSALDAVELRDALVRALATLPARQRAVLVLRYFDDLSEAAAAEALGCSVGTVKSTASRGLARLREQVDGFDLAFQGGSR